MRFVLYVLGILCVLIVLAGCRKSVAKLPPAVPTGWRLTAPGMEVMQCRWRASSGDTADLVAVRIDPARCDIRVLDARKSRGAAGNRAEMICPRQGAAINGCYFGDNHQPIGLLVEDGHVRQRDIVRQDFATFQLRRRRPEIVNSAKNVAAGVTQALECKPRLVVNGQIPHFKPQWASNRAAIGINAHGRVIIAATGSALSLDEWARCMREQFGCPNALNLDGGPSAQLTVHGQVNAAVNGGATVPVFLLCTPKT